MSDFRVTIFDVERGLCVFARTPNNYGILIDCGRSSNFSPAEWIANKAERLERWDGYALYKLVITHPHDDHVEDIDTIIKLLPPAVIKRQSSYDWQTVLNPSDHSPSANAQTYYHWQQGYNQPITSSPELGLTVEHFCLNPQESAEISPNSQHLLNNSSIVTVFT